MYSTMSRWSALARALLHEVLDLEHEVVGERAEQAEHRIVIGETARDQIAHQRHHAGAAGALVFLDRRRRRGRYGRRAASALVSEMTTQGSRSMSPRKAISTSPRAFSASKREIRSRWFPAPAADRQSRGRSSRSGPAPWCRTTAPRRGGGRAGRSGRRALGVAGELLDGARNREAAAGPVFAVRGQGEDGPVHVILLRNLREGAPHRTNEGK